MALSKLYEDIVAKVTLPYSSKEIQDIKACVEELLCRLVSGELIIDYNDFHGVKTILKFQCLNLKPCGSMEEKTSLWKSVRRIGRENKYIEFDYLAVLGSQYGVVNIREGSCQGCRKIYRNNNALEYRRFGPAFLSALYSRIETMCDCHLEPESTVVKSGHHAMRPCHKCIAVRETGYLQIAKVSDFNRKNVKHSEHCSLVFYWTSRTSSLMAPNIETLMLTERIDRLVIRVDILPAFEITVNREARDSRLKRFIVPKRCPNCVARKTFMISYNMYECHAIHNNVSETHKISYIMIKFLFGQFVYWTEIEEYLNNYYAKVAFLTHCQTCIDAENCTRCLLEILQSLVEVYTTEFLKLPQFHALKSINLRPPRARYYSDSHLCGALLCVESLLSGLYRLKKHDEEKHCQTCRSHYAVCLIKQTCLTLLEGTDTHGRCLLKECNTVSAFNILRALFEDKIMCYRIENSQRCISAAHLKRHFHCTERELEMLRFRMYCIIQKIQSSEIGAIKDVALKKRVEDWLEFIKEVFGDKKLHFFTIGQSLPELQQLTNNPKRSLLTPHFDECCSDNDNSNLTTSMGRYCVDGHENSDQYYQDIFTEDLELNWLVVEGKEELMKKELKE